MSKYVVDGRYIKLPLGQNLAFEYPVAEAIDIADVLVVMLDVPAGQIMNRNVFGVGCKDGRILWQVPARKQVYDDSPYTGLGQEGELVLLSNWDGLELIVNPRTGVVIDERHGR